MVEIRGLPLYVTRAYLIVGMIGSPLVGSTNPWMDGLMGFVQVDNHGRLSELPEDLSIAEPTAEWEPLRERMRRLLKIRIRNGKKVSGDW